MTLCFANPGGRASSTSVANAATAAVLVVPEDQELTFGEAADFRVACFVP